MAACCTRMVTCLVQVDFVELEKVALSSPDPIEDLPSGQRGALRDHYSAATSNELSCATQIRPWKVWRVSGLDAVRCLVLFKQVYCLFGKV